MKHKICLLALASIALVGCGNNTTTPTYESDFEETETYQEVDKDAYKTASDAADTAYVAKVDQGTNFKKAIVKGIVHQKVFGRNDSIKFNVDYSYERTEDATTWVAKSGKEEEQEIATRYLAYGSSNFFYTIEDIQQIENNELKYYLGDQNGFKIQGRYVANMSMEEMSSSTQEFAYYVFNSDDLLIHAETDSIGEIRNAEGQSFPTRITAVVDISYDL